MPSKTPLRRRRSIRLDGYDYSQPGAYFITLCTYQREPLFGEIQNGQMLLTRFARIVQQVWNDLPHHYPHVVLDAICIMPNHLHGIILIDHPERHGLAEIVRALKSFSARRINALRDTTGLPIWQRNYYERIIRNEQELQAVRAYILENPINWDRDHENPLPIL